jgi:DNA-directed RNA polymerase sigma subunit (sigma70/sigma32)
MDAVERYKPELNSFYNYYSYYLHMRFSNYVVSNAPFVYPQNRFWQVVKYWKIVTSFPLEFGRDATPEEIANLLQAPLSKIDQLKKDAERLHITSLDTPIDTDNNEEFSCIGDAVASDVDVENEVIDEMMERAMFDALWELATSKTGIDRNTLGLMYSGKISHVQASEILGVSYKKLRSMLYGGMDKIKRSKQIAELYEMVVATDRYYSYGLKHNGIKSFQETQTSGTELAVMKLLKS